jgi:hypothetical protein
VDEKTPNTVCIVYLCNGLDYEESRESAVAVCESVAVANRYIESHPITREYFLTWYPLEQISGLKDSHLWIESGLRFYKES